MAFSNLVAENRLTRRLPLHIFVVAGLALYLLPLKPMIAAPAGSTSKAIEFSRDIRPIFSDNCFTCHGPDVKMRQADLRLDIPKGPFEERNGYRIITPGESSKSRLFQRISSQDEAVRMPPAWSGRALTKEQIERIRQWIDRGAKWEMHWSFIAPQLPPLPTVQNRSWPRNPIDYFILARLEQEGIEPSPEADQVTLIRRLA